METMIKSNKKILVTLLFLICSTVLFSQNTLSTNSKEDIKNSANSIKKIDAKMNYKKSSINKITARKDSLLNIYGTFDAARKAGEIAPLLQKKTALTPKKK
jgi:predicted small secreted protein